MLGWISLHRKIADSQVWVNPELLKVWLWCLLKANHKDKWFPINTGRGTTEINCQVGEFICGRNSASSELNLSPSKFYSLLKKLSKIGNIKTENKTHYTKVIIPNYSHFQQVTESSEQTKNKQTTTKEQTKNTQTTPKAQPSNITNKDKKENNVKKENNNNTKLNSELRKEFESFYKEINNIDYYWTGKDNGGLKNLLKKLVFTMQKNEQETTHENLKTHFIIFIQNLPEWYKKNALDLTILSSKYSTILGQMINNNANGKKTANARTGLQQIDELYSQ